VDPRIEDVAMAVSFRRVVRRAALVAVATAVTVLGLVAPRPVPAHADAPLSLWSTSVVPGTPAADDSGAVTVGVKFRSDVAGFVTGVRFYKGPGNTGAHVGDLWTVSGTHLASATFTNETATGWQQVTFGSPVAIDANTLYVASYYAPAGHYAFDGNFFASPVNSGVLHAVADSESPNGVYEHGTPPIFPDQSWASSNYWVDVVFTTTPPQDVTPPQVLSTVPADQASGVAVGVAPSASFSESVQAGSVVFGLTGPGGAPVAGTSSLDASATTATFTPSAPLTAGTAYTATVSGATDGAGNTMTSTATWTFTTLATGSHPLDQGPGGPVLVVTTSSNPFSSYYAEILRDEGYDEFATAGISSVTASTLTQYSAVLLGETSLTSEQASMFSTWVEAGGNLIAMRPSAQLSSLLGITAAGGTLAQGYLKVDTSNGPGAGITDQTIQFHGTADRYTLSGARAVATLYSDATSATSNPAVTMRSVGSNGGQAAAFTYDLARSVVLTRQGNPAWAGQPRDGNSPIRSDDLFFGAAAGDQQPDWVDLAKVQIPQADEQQRLLGNLLTEMTLDRTPLPHFWYLPNGKRAAVVMTGDDHMNGGTVGRFDQYAALSQPGCSVANWECLRMTSYIFPGTPITNAQAQQYTAQGFEIGTHVSVKGSDNQGCDDFTPTTLATEFATQTGQIAAQLPGIPPAVSVRLHCVPWSDWLTLPRVELAHGVRLDTDYYYWPPTWIQDRPGLFTGSGMPMRFADTDGTMVDVYQATTQLTDESGQSYPKNIDTLLDDATGPLGYYAVVTVNAHTDDAQSNVSDAVVTSAIAHGVPVVSGRQMLTWLDARNASSFGGLTWDGTQLSFTVTADPGAVGLQTLLPAQSSSGAQLTGLTRDGATVPYTLETVKGVQYARFASGSGAYVAAYGSGGSPPPPPPPPPPPDTTPPVVTGINATPSTTSATVTWTTDEASTSRVDYGTSAALGQAATAPGSTTAHSVTLSGLAPATSYSFRVTSSDAAGNAATAPDPSGAPATFTTPAATTSTVTDTTAADFASGTIGSGGYVAQTGDGEVSLAPAAGTEFSGSALPSGWSATSIGSGGAATVGQGAVRVDGAYVRTGSTYTRSRSLEFVATFASDANQAVGLGTTLNEAPWIEFGTRGGGALWASTRANSGTQTNTSLGTTYLGGPHRFRIDWNASSVVYSIDGTVVATHNVSVTGGQRMVIRDGTRGGSAVSVDWMRLSPYATSTTFRSKVFDGGAAVTWSSATWTSSLPAGTSLVVSVRTGSTPTPGTSWSSFTTLPSSGAPIGVKARYAQYRLALATTARGFTPTVSDVSLGYTP
jgi:hypothetical protein